MKILIIGGTRFVGRYIAQAALQRGHELTLFHRGEHGSHLFPEAEHVLGDRTTEYGLAKLSGRQWDAVIDTCGYVPRIVKMSATALQNSTSRYLFISTISVYSDFSKPGMDEDGALARLEDPDLEEVNGLTYGGLKVLCEKAVESIYADRFTIVRPGLVVGPFDPTGRFTYWPARIAEGGAVLAPGQPDRRTQFIDARDLGEFTIHLVENETGGVFNANGPDYPLTMATVLETCRCISGSDARFTWVGDQFLSAEGVQPFVGLPLWVPDDPESIGIGALSTEKAVQAGITFRPLEETVADTLAWYRTLGYRETLSGSITPEKEQQILSKWNSNIIPVS